MKVKCVVYDVCREDVPDQDLPGVGNLMVSPSELGLTGVYVHVLSRQADDKQGIPRFSSVATFHDLEMAKLCGDFLAEHLSKDKKE